MQLISLLLRKKASAAGATRNGTIPPPHGAGRVMSRKKAFETLSLEEYRKAMEGIYTTTANQETIDEAPMACKQMEDIIDAIRQTVDNVEIIKPVYSFKASER